MVDGTKMTLSIEGTVDTEENTLYCALFCTHFCIHLKILHIFI